MTVTPFRVYEHALIQLFTTPKVRRTHKTKCDRKNGYYHVWIYLSTNKETQWVDVPDGQACECNAITHRVKAK